MQEEKSRYRLEGGKISFLRERCTKSIELDKRDYLWHGNEGGWGDASRLEKQAPGRGLGIFVWTQRSCLLYTSDAADE